MGSLTLFGTPMLATAGKNAPARLAELHEAGHYTFDVKWDGIRALAYITNGEVQLRNRRGANITSRYPDVVANLAATYPNETLVFDGEIVVWGGERFEFNLALKRDCQSSPAKIKHLAKTLPATYIAFDLLHHAGDDLARTQLCHRRTMLQRYIVRNDGLQLCMSNENGLVMWEAAEQFGFEGLVAKDLASTYMTGRQPSWVKLKRLKRCTVIVDGYDPGEGARRNKIGALHLNMVDDEDNLVMVGRAGSGLADTDHGPIKTVLDAGDQFIAEIEYLECGTNLVLRQPVYKGVRADVERASCTIDQLR